MRQITPLGRLRPNPAVSPLLLSDHLLTLAEQASHAGYRRAARRLLEVACRVLDDPPPRRHGQRTRTYSRTP